MPEPDRCPETSASLEEGSAGGRLRGIGECDGIPSNANADLRRARLTGIRHASFATVQAHALSVEISKRLQGNQLRAVCCRGLLAAIGGTVDRRFAVPGPSTKTRKPCQELR